MDVTVQGLAIAAFGGFAVGLERQWSGHATGPLARLGGIRTFTLLGAIGGLAGWLAVHGHFAAAALLFGGAIAIVVLGYAVASRLDVDGTTEVGALLVVAAGFVAGTGGVTLASAIFAITAVVLLEKSRLHAFARALDDEELRAAAQFAVMAVVVLPLLPEGPFGPGAGIRPRALWTLVLFFSGLSFLGYVARRIVGGRFGYPLAGLLGGMVSSTSVTLTFARLSRAQPAVAAGLAYGAVAASTILYARVALTSAVLSPPLGRTLWPYLAAPFLVGLVVLIAGVRHATREEPLSDDVRNPLQLTAALQMALIFQGVIFAMHAVRRHAGAAGVMTSGVVLGLTDLDALTISMAQGVSSGMAPTLAASAVAAGLIANTIFKAAIAAVFGRSAFSRMVVAALGAMALAIGLVLSFKF